MKMPRPILALAVAAVALTAPSLMAADAPTNKPAATTNAASAKTGAKLKPYTLKTCLVSGEILGEGGMTPVTLTNENQIIKFCCSSCVGTFKKDPAKYMKKLAEAEKAAAKEPKSSKDTVKP